MSSSKKLYSIYGNELGLDLCHVVAFWKSTDFNIKFSGADILTILIRVSVLGEPGKMVLNFDCEETERIYKDLIYYWSLQTDYK